MDKTSLSLSHTRTKSQQPTVKILLCFFLVNLLFKDNNLRHVCLPRVRGLPDVVHTETILILLTTQLGRDDHFLSLSQGGLPGHPLSAVSFVSL